MNQEQAFGILRAVLIYVGTTLATHGVVTDAAWQLYSGATIAVATAAWAVFVTHSLTADAFGSAVRSVFAAAAGYLQGRGYLSGDQATQLSGIVVLVIPAVWTWIAHRLPAPPK